MIRISAVIITYNEEKHIGRCLESLQKVADEIIVVDSFSTDSTPKICQNYSVKFLQRPYPGQIAQKQYALSLTKYDYVISLDGDEALSKELIDSILIEKSKGYNHIGYQFNRKSFYCGRWINHGDWYPDWKLRLWKKSEAFWGGIGPHDLVKLYHGKAKKLKGDLLHFTFESKQEHLKQIRKYASISAQAYFERKSGIPHIKMYLSPIFYFLKNYLIKGSFLDGKLGWQITKLAMMEKYLKYKELKELYESNH